MITVDLSGQEVPALGLGTWRLSGTQCVDAVRHALEAGYRHIDTAVRYGNEGEVAEAIRASGLDRSDIFLTTKIRYGDVAAADVRRTTKESLARLGTGHVDLLLVHWPHPDIPLRETMDALAEMREAGRTRLIGVSNYSVDWLRRAVEDCGAEIAVNQIEYHPFLRQDRVIAYCRRQGIAVAAAVPLARGAVGESPVIADIAARHSKTPAQVALRWLVQQDRVMALPKSASRRRIRENLDIFDFALSDDEMAAIAGLARGARYVDPEWAPRWDPD